MERPVGRPSREQLAVIDASIVALEPVNRANFNACVGLTVAPDQEGFVVANLYSIAQSAIEPTWVPLAVTHGETVIGFAMYGHQVDSGRWWIIRLMIGAEHQGKGFGQAAMEALIARLVDRHGVGEIRLGCVLGNDRARRLYERLGFRDTGEVEDNEAIMLLTL
jgi:diamine N-acetyltransferase